jgi:hypothetical protein
VSHQVREPIREEDVQGLKYFRKLGPLFERLHDEGRGRDKAESKRLRMSGKLRAREMGDPRGFHLPRSETVGNLNGSSSTWLDNGTRARHLGARLYCAR